MVPESPCPGSGTGINVYTGNIYVDNVNIWPYDAGMSQSNAARRYHHGDLNNALLQAAEQLLVEKGVAALSLRETAKLAGVSHAAPYRHFRDKAALLRALAQAGHERLDEAIRTAVFTGINDPEHRLVEAAVAYVQTAVAHPELTQLMFGGIIDPDGGADYRLASNAAFKTLVEIITPGIESGVFRERNPAELALVAWTSMHGLALLVIAGLDAQFDTTQQSLDALVRSLAQNVIYGISK